MKKVAFSLKSFDHNVFEMFSGTNVKVADYFKILKYDHNEGKLHVIGKTFTLIFFKQKFLKKFSKDHSVSFTIITEPYLLYVDEEYDVHDIIITIRGDLTNKEINLVKLTTRDYTIEKV